MESLSLSPQTPPAQARNARAIYHAAVTALAVIVVLTILVILVIGAGILLARRARGNAGPHKRADHYAAAPPRSGASLAQRAAWDIFRLNPCCTPWARFGDAPPGSYLAGAPCAQEGFCSGYGDPMWGGASERENFSPDAPGACSGQSCATQKAAAAARLEQGALAVAAGWV